MSLAETKLINFIFYHFHNVIIINNNKYAITDQISKKKIIFFHWIRVLVVKPLNIKNFISIFV